MNELLNEWIIENDLDVYALQDPVRVAYFAAWVMTQGKYDPWDVRMFVEEMVNKTM